ncbi:MAG: hypothetical protein HQ582_16170, partial [Planctomycetes bacterium]|nr:hypothetical protein [Planctomycetota bacterium]
MGTRSKGGSTSPRRSTGSRPSRRRAKASVFSRPTLWVVASLGVFLAASYLFFTAKPYHDPYTRPSPVSVDFWVCPFEINPARRVLHVNQHLRDVFALPGSDEAWVVGDQGTVLHTDDGGWTWQSQENPALVRREPIKGSAPAPENAAGRFPTPFTFASLAEAGPTVRPALTSVFFLHDGRTGWIGGKQPIVWATDDAGKTWNQAFGPTVEYDALIDLHFFDKSVGVGLYPPYLILTTADGGESWIEGLCPPDVVSLSAVDAQHLWAVTLDGEILFSTDAGKSWLTRTTVSPRAGKASQGSGPEDVSRSGSFKVFFADVDHGWAVVDTGRIWRTRDGGASWSGYDLQPLAGRFDVHFANSQKGWIVGGSGLILATIDGGVTWRKQTSGVGEHLLAVDFSDARTGWAVGYSGTILKTTDGGNTWWRQTRDLSRPAPTETPYLWLPGPGYYAMIVVAGLFLVPLYLRREKQPPLTETKSRVAERFASDRPLEAGDPDHLEFRPTALALAKFLRNEDTVPPVTVAVTGKWGTGKSSLMRLVHGDLTKHSFRPVWFNAWHHQKEEQLLASLLENVRSQAVPPWSDPLTRLRFRLRLLSRRVWRYWWIVLVLGILGFAIGHVPVVQRLTGTITFPERQGPEAGEGPASDTASADADHNLPAELAWYSFLIGVIAAVWK